MKKIIIILLAFGLTGCGVSSIKCEIETDEELLERIINDAIVNVNRSDVR